MPGSAIAAAALVAAFGALLLYPSLIGQVWGARRVPAPTTALATTVEILVATGSAALPIGTELGPVALLGGAVRPARPEARAVPSGAAGRGAAGRRPRVRVGRWGWSG